MSDSTRIIESLDQTISTFKSKVNVKINNISTSSINIKETTDKIYENLGKLKGDMLKSEEKHIAYENILRLNQTVKEQFSHYETIRRTVIGVVREFDINLVRNSTITELSEELWITSSRYWLSYALIAITGWINDFKDVASNALSESMRRDPVKTSLFFCLMNLRFNRNAAASSWFLAYMQSLDLSKLQNETAILLEAFINGVFGKDRQIEYQVSKIVESFITSVGHNEEWSRDMDAAYITYIENMKSESNISFDALFHCSPQYDAIKDVCLRVSKYDSFTALIKSLDVELPSQLESDYLSRVDEILVNLITNFDKEELEIKNQQDYYSLVVSGDGDTEYAKLQSEAKQKLTDKSEFNIGKQMIKWALYDDSSTTNVYVRRFGLNATKLWFTKAIASFSDKIDAKVPLEYRLNIDSWSTDTKADDLKEQTKSLLEYFKINKFKFAHLNALNIILAALFALSLGGAVISKYSLAISAASVIFLIVRFIIENKKYKIRQNNAVEKLTECMAEITRFNIFYEESKIKRNSLLEQLGKI